jgi:hypothetical protein
MAMSEQEQQESSEGSIGQSASTAGLEPCPFCGNHDSVHVIAYHACDYVDQSEGLEGFIVICDASGFGRKNGCGAATGWYETIDEAKAAWNRRSNAS